MRVTVKNAFGTVAQGEVQVHDPDDDGEVAAVARKLCAGEGRRMPEPATVVVEEPLGRGRWRQVRRVVV